MKKKQVVKILIILLCLAVIVGFVLIYQVQKRKREEWAQQQILKIEYRQQNETLPKVEGYSRYAEYYVGYEAIDEAELYVQLAAYNEHIEECKTENEVELSLSDFEEYLSTEYNEDGSLRIHEGYEHIQSYVHWFWKEEGDLDIAEYWRDLGGILLKFCEQNPGVVNIDTESMNIVQLQELIEKKNNPSYEINVEIMKGE